MPSKSNWIKAHLSLPNHPKTIRAASKLKIGIPQLIGHLNLLWMWCLEYAEDGDITQYSDEELAIVMKWEGSPSDILGTLIGCHWIDDSDIRRTVHNWTEYTGELIEKRRVDRERKKLERSGGHPAEVQRVSDVEERREDQSRKEQSKGEGTTPEGNEESGGSPFAGATALHEMPKARLSPTELEARKRAAKKILGIASMERNEA